MYLGADLTSVTIFSTLLETEGVVVDFLAPEELLELLAALLGWEERPEAAEPDAAAERESAIVRYDC